jgi:16S rRNA (cytidine1402-2'-O)-methyltransferase
MGKLFIVATPIGNLSDITFRALETLKSVDIILAEDIRVTLKLLNHYQIKKQLISYHKYSSPKVYKEVYNLLKSKKNIALVSDAGTPCISDPGAKLIAFLLNQDPKIQIIPVPGPSALITALSVSGINADKFTFLGYPPHKKKRKEFFKKIKEIKIWPIVLYESPHRLLKTLNDLKEVLGDEIYIVIAKELTKIYEEIWRGKLKEAIGYFNLSKIKGEYVLILNKV